MPELLECYDWLLNLPLTGQSRDTRKQPQPRPHQLQNPAVLVVLLFSCIFVVPFCGCVVLGFSVPTVFQHASKKSICGQHNFNIIKKQSNFKKMGGFGVKEKIISLNV